MGHANDLFPGRERDAATHLELHRRAAESLATSYLIQLTRSRGDDPDLLHTDYPWLDEVVAGFRAFMPPGVGWEDGPSWWRAAIERWESAATERLPLRALADLAGAGVGARIVLMLVGLVEDDVRFGSLFEALQHPVARRRPCIGLVEQAARLLGDDDPMLEPWIRAGFVIATDELAPRVERSLRVAPSLWDGLTAGAMPPLSGYEVLGAADAVPWPEALARYQDTSSWSRLPELLGSGESTVVIVRGRRGSGRRALLSAAVAGFGRHLLTVRIGAAAGEQRECLEQLAIVSALRGDLPVIEADLGPGESVDLAPLAHLRGAACVLLRRDGGVQGLDERKRVTLEMPAPTVAALERVWSEGLGAEGADLSPADLALTVRLPIELARRAARGAREAARTAGRDRVRHDEIRTAVRALGASDLDRLAERVEARGSWDDLVTSAEARSELALVERSCRIRRAMAEHLGPAFRAVEPRGTKILLHGPSGVGKSLAVRILAACLAKDLYVADLGALHDKWVGESEKAVSRLLAAAEERDVVLLIDEGDALMARRSSTSGGGASERFGNLLTNHLLTRLESFEGVLAVTTNALARTDPAFARRFDAVVRLPLPTLSRRVAIFERHLRTDAGVDRAELVRLARSGPLTGGQIRNAVLHAARLASAGERSIEARDLERGVRRELRKAGSPAPQRQPLPRGAGALHPRFDRAARREEGM